MTEREPAPTNNPTSATRATAIRARVGSGTPFSAQARVNETSSSQVLATDLLRTADEIAEFIYGSKEYRRSVYNLVHTNRIPHFRIGGTVCARKSILLGWITAQEERSADQ
jgi:hypothetical protein